MIFHKRRIIWDGVGVIFAILFNGSTAEESSHPLSEGHDYWRDRKNR